MKYPMIAMLMVMAGSRAGGSISDTAGDLRGIKGIDGDKRTHINTRNYAISFLMEKPMLGDATLNATV